MAKIIGLVGTMSGRVGNMVFSKKDGKTIARSYQPQVANPNTFLQVQNRSKLKLASQFAAALGDFGRHYLASMGKKVSDRGALVSRIYGATLYTVPSGQLVDGYANVSALSLAKSGLYPVEAPTLALVDDTKITATYTPGTVQEGEIVTLVVIAAPEGADAGDASMLQSRQAVMVGTGAAATAMTATIDVNPAFLGMKHNVSGFVLRSRLSLDTVLPVAANKAVVGGAQGLADNRGIYLLQSGIAAPAGNRVYSDVAVATLEVEPE